MRQTTTARRQVAHPRPHDYALSPFTEPRPETGRVTLVVECAHCGRAVRCRVHSLDGVQRLRARWRVLSVLSLVVLAAVLVVDTIVISGISPERPASTPVATLLALSSVVMAGCVLFFFRARRLVREDDGVRLIGWFFPHRLRWSSYKSDE